MSDQPENNPTPFHVELMAKGNLLHTAELASLIAQPGDNQRDLAVKVRGLVNRGYLIPVGRDMNDARKALLFDPAAALAAAALLAAADAGLSGKDKFQRIANALQMWTGTPPQKGEPKNPAAFAVLTQMQSDEPHGFSVELRISRQTGTGRLDYRAAVLHSDHGYLGSGVVISLDDHMPVASLVLPLDAHLTTIVGNLRERERKRKMN